MPDVRIVLVEDNRLFRETLELLFGLREGIDVVGSVASGAEAVSLCAKALPDVVVIDYRMPGLDGAQATREILRAAPETRVICLTASVTREERQLVLEAGAIACLTKDENLDRIVESIVAVGAGTLS
jgi:two-component system, NarL family, response regulator LiaR